MAIGPVQLIALGFTNPDFHGEIIAELERLHQSGTVRVIDSLAVYKDADGELEVEHLSNLSEAEAIELGSKIGALIGLGFEGEEGMEGMEAGAFAGGFISPLDLVALGLVSAEEARELHELETASAAGSTP